MAIGTGALRDTTNIVLSRLGIIGFFSIVVTAEDVRKGKPSPEIYLRVMAQAAVEPVKTLIIEDSTSGLEAAIASKAYVASVRKGEEINHPNFMGKFADLYALLLELRIGI